jgi:hypothetical protein
MTFLERNINFDDRIPLVDESTSNKKKKNDLNKKTEKNKENKPYNLSTEDS